MLYFSTRALARAYVQKAIGKIMDMGKDSPRRWAVKVVNLK